SSFTREPAALTAPFLFGEVHYTLVEIEVIRMRARIRHRDHLERHTVYLRVVERLGRGAPREQLVPVRNVRQPVRPERGRPCYNVKMKMRRGSVARIPEMPYNLSTGNKIPFLDRDTPLYHVRVEAEVPTS